ncbi:MAG: NADH-quinone oxidoreductase subunit H [bacterium]|nr:NADH-quinone oxidoreductase subunit H [bacterium]
MIKLILLLILPLLFTGVINKTKALFQGKKGAPLVQPYFEFIKLLSKEEIISKTTSFVFQIAPSVNFACVIIASLLITVVHFNGDFILFSYILALGKFFTVIAALDTGSSFEGMGASREVSYTSFVESAFFIILGSIAAMNGIYSFSAINSLFEKGGEMTLLIGILTCFALFMMMLIEGSRVPVDDPKTHLELTMIHEVMVLDNSGVNLAFIHYANALKMLLFAAVISNIFSFGNIFVFLIVVFAIAVLIGIIESLCARIRLTHIIEYTFVLIIVALLVMALVLLVMHGGNA